MVIPKSTIYSQADMAYDWIGVFKSVYIMSSPATLPQFYSYEHALDMDCLLYTSDAADE